MKRIFSAVLIVVSVFLAPVPIAQASVIQLVVAPDRLSGYDRSLFKLWIGMLRRFRIVGPLKMGVLPKVRFALCLYRVDDSPRNLKMSFAGR